MSGQFNIAFSNVSGTLLKNDFLARGGEIIKVKSEEGNIYEWYFDTKDRYVFLTYVKNSSGMPGFGVEVIRKMMNKTEEYNCLGAIKVDAVWSSHLFYLKMGFIPLDRPLDYVEYQYGQDGNDALEFLEQNDDLKEENLSYAEHQSLLFRMLSKECGISRPTINDLIDKRDILIGLKQKEASFLRDRFIPSILKIIQATPPGERPDTSRFGAILMVLSEMGKQRWIEAIRDVKIFEPFDVLEYLAEIKRKI